MSFANIDVDSEIGIKQREISRLGLEKKAVIRDFEESSVELKKAGVMLTEKEQLLIKKEHAEKEMFLQSKKLFDEKGDFEDEGIGQQQDDRNAASAEKTVPAWTAGKDSKHPKSFLSRHCGGREPHRVIVGPNRPRPVQIFHSNEEPG